VSDTTHTTLIETFELGLHWPTIDPFLFVAHHRDDYPPGNGAMAPAASLGGRALGQDFSGKDGWSMYHGRTVPGFPQHPHRGFETITYVRRGFIDHSDSLGATARFGRGDTQWMTAGAGVVHSEMFPLIDEVDPNPTELFQIWLNLPAADKLVDPYFTMIWSEDTPVITETDDQGRTAAITVVVGPLHGRTPTAPPPDSWASKEHAEVAIWHVTLDPGASWELPATIHPETNRALYAFAGSFVDVGEERLDAGRGAIVATDRAMRLTAGPDGVEVLVMTGRPIAEPIAQYGPFVMNTNAEIHQTMIDYQRTGFGGWPWASDDPVHPSASGRFAIHADGRRNEPS
jgi:redox-sensitive bicupin YhaK (pirin superfamily)